MSILSFQMFNAIKGLNARVDSLSKFAASQASSQPPASSSSPDSGYVLEPEKQSSMPVVPENQVPEGAEPGIIKTQGDGSGGIAADKENIPPDGASYGTAVPGDNQAPPADGGNELGGGAPISPSDDGYLAAAGADSSDPGRLPEADSNAAQGELAGNPEMGGNGAVSPDYNSNPSTGS